MTKALPKARKLKKTKHLKQYQENFIIPKKSVGHGSMTARNFYEPKLTKINFSANPVRLFCSN